jgi:hypothetical protein
MRLVTINQNTLGKPVIQKGGPLFHFQKKQNKAGPPRQRIEKSYH